MGKATKKMMDFAEAIATELGLKKPDYDDFEETSAFIDENKDEYYEQTREDWL